MGSEIQIRRDGSNFDPTEIVGYGFAGIECLVCVGDACKVFVNRKQLGMLDGEERPKFRSGICRKSLRVIALVDNEYGDVDGILGSCPIYIGNPMAAGRGCCGFSSTN